MGRCRIRWGALPEGWDTAPQVEEVSLHETDCAGRAFLVEYDDRERAVIRVTPRTAGAHRVEVSTNDRRRPLQLRGHPGSELGDHALAGRRASPTKAYLLPEGTVRHRTSWAWLGTLAAASLFVVLVAVGTWVQTSNVFLTVLMTVFAAAVVHRPFRHSRGNHRYVTDAYEGTFDAYRPASRELADTSRATVDAVKAEYGALFSDVVLRIEQPALFDVEVPATREFTRLMARWDDDRERLTPKERTALAARLRVAFDAARAHAERVGMDHLPPGARPPARRALGALRLARDPHAEAAERREALRRANDILASLMLHYLPRPDEASAMLEGRSPKALPGRIEREE